MDTATISAISALAGTAVGGLTSGLTTLLNQSAQARVEQIRHDLGRREDLVRDFIIAASKTYGEAFTTNEPQMPEIVNLYSMVSRMRVLAMPRSVACAENLILVIIDTYFQPNKTIRDLHEMMRSSGGVDPLREFSEAAGNELAALKSR
jgi:hypothetical protein